MAGLTKSQRAQRAAGQAAPAQAANPDEPELVTMEKDGQTMAVHPTCVHAHRLVNWKEVPHAD